MLLPVVADASTIGALQGTAPSGVTPVVGQGSVAVVPRISSGAFHTCALLSDGTVRCWGDNRYGQLGDGTLTSRSNPVVVLASGSPSDGDALSGVTAISAGEDHTCALLSDSTVRCWGANWDGALGDGTTTPRANPVQVLASGTAAVDPIALSGVSQVSSGGYHTCALLTDGTVRCWGANWAPGQLGDGTDVDGRANPVQVLLSGSTQGEDVLSGVAQLASGEEHTCALLTDGTVRCWGANWDGMVGDGTAADARLNPMQVLLSGSVQGENVLTGVLQVSAGSYHTCALLSDGTVRCWGANWYAMLGDGTDADARLNPVQVLASGSTQGSAVLTEVVAVAAGSYHTCALLSDATVRCWGANWSGQLGDGTDLERSNPVQVLAAGSAQGVGVLSGVAAVSHGEDHSCALLTDATVRCWGDNASGQLGDGTRTARADSFEVLATGSRPSDPPPVVLSGLVAISAGADHTCALLADGTVRCWGENDAGQLGDGSTTGRPSPVEVLSGVTQVSSGEHFTCALLDDGTLRCWGSDAWGRLGDGDNGGWVRPVPGMVLASGTVDADPVVLSGVTQVSAGARHACALLDVGTVRCWGSNDWGQLGDGSEFLANNPVAVLVSGTAQAPVVLSDVTQISSGFGHTCALLADTSVRCWGANFGPGQLGDGTTTYRSYPVEVLESGIAVADPVALSGVTRISSGLVHTCALLGDNTLRCWGGNDEPEPGRLGDGTTQNRSNPVTVLASGATQGSDDALSAVHAISAGGGHTCAVLDDGTVRCWGSNRSGALGDGSTIDRLNPVTVPVAGATSISSGTGHTCVVLDDGTARCWGSNGSGRLGDNSGLPWSAVPVSVLASGSGSAEPPVVLVLGSMPSQDPPAAPGPSAPSLTPSVSFACDPRPTLGRAVTCSVRGGDAGIDILWRAAYNPVFAEGVVRLGADGQGSFAFTVPAAAVGSPVSVELVGWLSPVTVGVAGGPVPSTVPAGDGGPFVPVLLLLALGAAGTVLRHRRA